MRASEHLGDEPLEAGLHGLQRGRAAGPPFVARREAIERVRSPRATASTAATAARSGTVIERGEQHDDHRGDGERRDADDVDEPLERCSSRP
jgi:hypothetical protein